MKTLIGLLVIGFSSVTVAGGDELIPVDHEVTEQVLFKAVETCTVEAADRVFEEAFTYLQRVPAGRTVRNGNFNPSTHGIAIFTEYPESSSGARTSITLTRPNTDAIEKSSLVLTISDRGNDPNDLHGPFGYEFRFEVTQFPMLLYKKVKVADIDDFGEESKVTHKLGAIRIYVPEADTVFKNISERPATETVLKLDTKQYVKCLQEQLAK